MLKQTEVSLRSLRRAGYLDHVWIFTDIQYDRVKSVFGSQDFVFVHNIPKGPGWHDKTKLFDRLTSFDYTHVLYVDSDTYFLNDINPVWEEPGSVMFRQSIHNTLGAKVATEIKEIARGLPRGKYVASLAEVQVTEKLVPAESCFYHSGVFMFRFDPAAKTFFEAWKDETKKYEYTNDEWPLCRAAHNSGVWPTKLDYKYNSWPLWHANADVAKEAGVVIEHFYGPLAKPLFPLWF